MVTNLRAALITMGVWSHVFSNNCPPQTDANFGTFKICTRALLLLAVQNCHQFRFFFELFQKSENRQSALVFENEPMVSYIEKQAITLLIY